MKTLLGIAAALAVVGVSLATIDSADARGIRGAGNITRGNIQVGPRVTAPVIRPGRVGTQQFPQRQIRGPCESGNGINCRFVGWRWETRHITGSSQMYRRRVPHTQCPQRY